MSEYIERASSQTPDWLFADQQPNTLCALGQTALFDMGMEVTGMHFYGADDSLVGVTQKGAEIIVRHPWAETVVGAGRDVDAALGDMIERMRTLETVQTRSVAEIAMTDTAQVNFTRLERYTPKVAPSETNYLIPDYLSSLTEDSMNSDSTYRVTKRQKGWEGELHSLLEFYLENDPDGQKLAAGLKVRSLRHLTPEQAVKLSTAFVQNVSKYSYDEVGEGYPTDSDVSTTFELLVEGIANKNNPKWEGNGICRNVACNVKAVFEALKHTQVKLSMLNNTYCIYNASANGVGYADARSIKETLGDAHAWNTFVTVGPTGSAVATITDATWALGKSMDSVIEHLDQTEIRTVAQIMRLFEKSEVKEKAFQGLTASVKDLVELSYTNPSLHITQRRNIREFAVTEYLEAAVQLADTPKGFALPRVVARVAYTQLKNELDDDEIMILSALDRASGGHQQQLIRQLRSTRP